MPEPMPVLAVTVHVVPLPVTAEMKAPLTPLAASANALASTPVTLWLNVTVHDTVAALVGLESARLIETTVADGGGLSAIVRNALMELVTLAVVLPVAPAVALTPSHIAKPPPLP